MQWLLRLSFAWPALDGLRDAQALVVNAVPRSRLVFLTAVATPALLNSLLPTSPVKLTCRRTTLPRAGNKLGNRFNKALVSMSSLKTHCSLNKKHARLRCRAYNVRDAAQRQASAPASSLACHPNGEILC